MELQDKLEIFFITYNRKQYLKKTFDQIFSKASPIKILPITILDNCSTDGTSELITSYCKKYNNIKHIRHKKNIGGNANIVRAFELASKKYFWILCDDDIFNWTYWEEILEGIKNNADVILTERRSSSHKLQIPYIINELAFCPSGIYKTENLTSTVLQNSFINIYTSFPHLALACHLVNENKVFFVPKHTVLSQGEELRNENQFIRGFNDYVHHRQQHVSFFSGYINSYQMIKNKKIRYQCCDVLWIGRTFLYSMTAFFRSTECSKYNFCDIWNGISWRQRVQLLCVSIIFIIPKSIINRLRAIKKIIIKINI